MKESECKLKYVKGFGIVLLSENLPEDLTRFVKIQKLEMHSIYNHTLLYLQDFKKCIRQVFLAGVLIVSCQEVLKML